MNKIIIYEIRGPPRHVDLAQRLIFKVLQLTFYYIAYKTTGIF